jgi:hypothetical protein
MGVYQKDPDEFTELIGFGCPTELGSIEELTPRLQRDCKRIVDTLNDTLHPPLPYKPRCYLSKTEEEPELFAEEEVAEFREKEKNTPRQKTIKK